MSFSSGQEHRPGCRATQTTSLLQGKLLCLKQRNPPGSGAIEQHTESLHQAPAMEGVVMKTHGKTDKGGWGKNTLGKKLFGGPGTTQWGGLGKGGKIFLFPETAPRNHEWA